MSEHYLSDMRVLKIVFDEFSFKRLGYLNDNEAEMKLTVDISENENQSVSRVTLTALATKDSEYILEVKVSGFFEFSENITPVNKEEMLKINGVAILMPYIRSQVSILTAQPETNSLMLPIMNINRMMNDSDEKDEDL